MVLAARRFLTVLPVLLVGVAAGARLAGAAPPGADPPAAGAAAASGPAAPAADASPPPPAVSDAPPAASAAAPPPDPPPPSPAAAAVAPAAPPGPVLPSPPSIGTLYSPLGAIARYDLAGSGDPWEALPHTPGLLMSRAYVAGYGSRPGEAFVGPGATGGQGVFRIDGFEVGDAASPGGLVGVSALSAQEVQVTTGGADLGALSPGLQINLVERRGTNEWRASARGLGSGGPLAAGASRVDGLAPGQAASEDVRGDRVRDTGALGAELGGPLRQDGLWMWASLERAWTAANAFGGQPENTSDLGAAAKLDLRLPAAHSATLSWNRASRAEAGEGAGPDRAPETTLDRHAHDDVWRLADTAILSPSLYAAAAAGRVETGAHEAPRGAFFQPLLLDAAGVAHGSWYADDERRATSAASGEVSESGRIAGAASELKLAGEWRQTLETSRWEAPAWAQITAGQVLGLPHGLDALALWRDGDSRDRLTRLGLWAADTLSWSRATASFGLRYDQQTPRNLASSVPGVPGDSLLVPIQFAGNDAGGVRWRSLAPRLAAAFAPAGERRLLLRASLARYAAQLGGAVPMRVDPAAPASAAYFLATGRAGARALEADAGEADEASFWYSNGIDPRLPAGVPANVLDRRLRPELTDEAILGAEQPLGTDGLVGLRLVYRRVSRVLEDRLLVRDAASDAARLATAADWVPAGVASGSLPDGAPYRVPYYDLRPGLAPTGGTLLVNGHRQQRLLGLAVEWRQRLARRWTARGRVTWQDWTWRVGPDYRRYADPTVALVDGNYDGEPVAGQSPLPGGRPLYLASRWSFDLAGVVELPGAFSAAAELNGRQGYPLAYYRTVARASAGPVDVRASGRVDAFRSDDLASLDLRLDKQIDRRSDLGIAVSLEALNLVTSGQVLRRETNLGVGRANFVDEVVAPRLLRLGLKLDFR
jgi:hypothetical protein